VAFYHPSYSSTLGGTYTITVTDTTSSLTSSSVTGSCIFV
jgi:hypothetical protein